MEKILSPQAMLESDKVEVKDGLLRSLEDPTKWPILVSRNVSETNGMWLRTYVRRVTYLMHNCE